VVEQSGLFYGLLDWDACEVLDDVARVSTWSLSDDVTSLDSAAVDGAAQLGAAKAFCKGPDERVLTRAWVQTTEWNWGGAGDARAFQPLTDLADEAVRCPGALVNAEEHGLCGAALGQVRSEIGHAGAFRQDDKQPGWV
jgi:hypothetical protein